MKLRPFVHPHPEPSIVLGDCLDVLRKQPANTVDLIVTSPRYADRRKNTYGGVKPEEYVDWFLPCAEQFLRVLKPEGTFILNIKEKVEKGERHMFGAGCSPQSGSPCRGRRAWVAGGDA